MAAKQLLIYIRHLSILDAIDIILFDEQKYPKNLDIYQLLPAIVMQTDQYLKCNPHNKIDVLASQLEATRGKESKVKKSLAMRLKREVLRLFRPVYMTKITFK